MTDRPDHWENPDPERFHFEVKPADGWRLLWTEKRCRYAVGPNHQSCKRPAVAALNRGRMGKQRWWAYCDAPGHMFGRWIEDGQVVEWHLVEGGTGGTINE